MMNTISSILKGRGEEEFKRKTNYIVAGDIRAKNIRVSFKSIRSLNLNIIIIIVFI